ncbi:MAG: hypothetical protein DMG31_15980 [Acidobacteria bacterium]|nr:MAG: hypothetical protein DMG31_15980 [Acidobacteriota bacterium]
MMKRFFAYLVAIAASGLPACAHVGSPDVFVEGNAGPYKLFVTVRVPQVIPGIAEIEIRSESNDVSAIRIAPMQLTGPGSQYPPAPEAAERSKDDPQFFRGSLWLMEFGSLQVRIEAEGTKGKGLLAVPIPAIAQRTLPMQRSLGLLLFVLMIVLSLAMISIVAAAVREGNLAPGAPAPAARERRVRLAAGIGGFVVAAVLTVGGLWWRADARQYASHIYTPPEIEALISANGQLILRAKPIRMTSGNPRRPADWIDFQDLILDHEHWMHLFLIRRPGMNVFWHLHPERAGSGSFTQNLPAMPAGHYQIFADVVLSSGFPVTLVGQIDLPSALAGTPLTGDDSGTDANPIPSETGARAEYPLPGGGRMIWERDGQPLEAGVPLMLRFRVTDGSGNAAQDLEPYMGMAAHAAIVRSDGSVFAHVHPTGSVPMASFELAQASLPASLGGGVLGAMNMKQMTADKIAPEISIPYGFPKAGLYRIFVQVKRSGQIQTAFFDAIVK